MKTTAVCLLLLAILGISQAISMRAKSKTRCGFNKSDAIRSKQFKTHRNYYIRSVYNGEYLAMDALSEKLVYDWCGEKMKFENSYNDNYFLRHESNYFTAKPVYVGGSWNGNYKDYVDSFKNTNGGPNEYPDRYNWKVEYQGNKKWCIKNNGTGQYLEAQKSVDVIKWAKNCGKDRTLWKFFK